MSARNSVRRSLQVILGIALVACLGFAQTPTVTMSEMQLRMGLHDGWDAHARLTHSYIVSLLAGLPDSSRVKQRLVEAANDVGDAMNPYFPGATMPGLANLMKRNVLLTARAVAAVRSSDSIAIAAARANWVAATDSVVLFLVRTNPNWPEGKLGASLRNYQDQTWRQIAARARQDWSADVAATDQAHIEARAIADVLSSGIVKQFPNRFK